MFQINNNFFFVIGEGVSQPTESNTNFIHSA